MGTTTNEGLKILSSVLEQSHETAAHYRAALTSYSDSLTKIAEEAQPFFTAGIDNGRYKGVMCLACQQFHDCPGLTDAEVIQRKGFLRHVPSCPVKKLEEVLSRA